MKEEQKAKRYDEAIKIAKSKIKNDKDHILYENDIIEIFPELKESEGERIRKWLIYYFEEVCDNVSEKEKKGVLAWLEKQGEKEPKFKVGDKIQYSKGCGIILTIEKIENGEYIFCNNMGHTTIEYGNKWYLVNG